MEVRGLSAIYHKALIGNTLLPFLYRTTTLQSPVRLLTPTTRRRSFHTTRPSQGVHINKHSAIPFEKEDGTYEHDLTNLNPWEDRAERKTTITASEKLVFQRILGEISADQIKKASKEEDPLPEDPELHPSGPDGSPGDLDALFEAALVEAGYSDDARTRKPTLERPVKHSNLALNPFKNTGTRKLEKSLVIGDEYPDKIALAVAHHDRKVQSMLHAATSDREIWSVLETHVFSLIENYDSLEKEAKEQPGKPRGGRGRGRGPLVAATKNLHPLGQSDQIEELHAILSSNYAKHCLEALRDLRHSYPTSPYCMSLLPAIKRLGPMSHALAASVELYNEIFFLQWREYNDLHAMADTIVEMANLGIETDRMTLFTFWLVHKERRKMIDRPPGDPKKLWWTMAPMWEGSQKLEYVWNELTQEKEQSRMRKSMERAHASSMDEAERTTEGEAGDFAGGQQGPWWKVLPEQRLGGEERSNNTNDEPLTTPIML
ncbi:MAG: hypothetical protein Q9212_001129 [Teloschistes hypoglaucus]